MEDEEDEQPFLEFKTSQKIPFGIVRTLTITHLTTIICGAILTILGAIAASANYAFFEKKATALFLACMTILVVVIIILSIEYFLIVKKYPGKKLSNWKLGVLGFSIGFMLFIILLLNSVLGTQVLRESLLLSREPTGPIPMKDISKYMDSRVFKLTDIQLPADYPSKDTVGEKMEIICGKTMRACIAPVSEIPDMNIYIGCLGVWDLSEGKKYNQFKNSFLIRNCEQSIERGWGCFRQMQQNYNTTVLVYRIIEGVEEFNLFSKAANKFEAKGAVMLELMDEATLARRSDVTFQLGQKKVLYGAVISWAFSLLPIQVILMGIDCFMIFKLELLAL